MKKTVHEKRNVNRARLANDVPTEGNGLCCDNHLLFAMKDNYHEFTLGITTVLECLAIAEKSGAVPELPSEWWIQIVRHYSLNRSGLSRKM
ncbi:MAG: hypothetical protein LBE75_05040 [Burkholderiales bacterium]|jgi:hypothetical protein|nr:hypothetical protein [Burkholderiales bacterium]